MWYLLWHKCILVSSVFPRFRKVASSKRVIFALQGGSCVTHCNINTVKELKTRQQKFLIENFNLLKVDDGKSLQDLMFPDHLEHQFHCPLGDFLTSYSGNIRWFWNLLPTVTFWKKPRVAPDKRVHDDEIQQSFLRATETTRISWFQKLNRTETSTKLESLQCTRPFLFVSHINYTYKSFAVFLSMSVQSLQFLRMFLR